MNKIHGLLALILLLSIIVGLYLYTQNKSDIVDAWTEHVNNISGYSVSYPKVGGMVGKLGSGPDNDGYSAVTEDEADVNVYNYTIGENSAMGFATLGIIYCPNTVHMYENLNNGMTVAEYAQNLFDNKVNESFDYISAPLEYDLIKSYSGQSSYSFTMVENKRIYPSNPSVVQYVIAENSKGVKCTISYHTHDKITPLFPKISILRAEWFMSFKWLQ